ncbi:Phospholipase SGR2 [Striga hermonthica]|uniref:Phospholipase SGR2 n=1 Tax=Striga hermonthica TaxID=68872 RepID=A0A9N7NZR5_STRHE|nr:Phospholipase SGR2 [Striga hermonthica]
MPSGMGATSGEGGAEETSPDMLKNTPSNIRRLVNEIEQCEGRQKYLAHTRSPSDGGDVRWYFCKVPLGVNEVAASVPRTEIVGKGDYFRFGMRDSLAIEASFLQREDELLSSWWKEYAECSEGPKGQLIIKSISNQQLSSESPQVFTDEEERVGVPVKGGLYEVVDLVKRHCFPVYWTGENRRVLRGHWFARKGGLDWLPLREDVSEQLEYAYRSQVWHRRTFQVSGLFAARVDLQGSTAGLHALFTGEDDTWEAWLSVDASGISSVVSIGRNGIKLRRGYAPSQSKKLTQDELRQRQEEEMDDYCSQVPVRHLVFMVHGIGQRLEKSNLVDDVGNFRQLTANLAERHLTSHQRGTQRVLYIPCQWRKGLRLSGEAAVEKITLDGVRGLRTMLSATVHDVLYYMSPIYCQDIIDSVSIQLNRLYLKFLKRNPGYDGKVSIYGHSLGSVLSYDILCHQETLYSPFPMEWLYNEPNRSEVSCPANINLSSDGNLISTPGDHSLVNNEVDSIVSHADNPELHEERVDGPYNQLGPPTVSESEESTTIDTGYQQIIDASSDEKCITFDNIDQINNVMNDGNSIRNEVVACDDTKDCEDVFDSDKDEIIKSLREEIDILKAKIKEFEAECADEVNAMKSATAVNQYEPNSIRPGSRDRLMTYTPLIRYTKLEFKVDTFFAVGSPLGVFLSLRNIRIGIGKGKDYWEEENINEEMPACRKMFNIFHPFDPVAYRIEPLICKEFIHKRPVIVPYHRGGKRLYVGFQEFKEGVAARSQAFKDNLSTVRVKVLTICESRCTDDPAEEPEDVHEKEERSYGSVMMERLTGSVDGRIDHVLQDKSTVKVHESSVHGHGLSGVRPPQMGKAGVRLIIPLQTEEGETMWVAGGAVVGLMNVAGHATPTKELRWLSAVFAGILMCKVVYDLTGVISSLLFKGYNKLNDKAKLEWNNRGFSTFHAIVVAAGSLYLLLVSDLFAEAQDGLIVHRSSPLSDTVLGVSIGYFLSDLSMIFYHYPTLGGMEYVVHHGLSMYCIILSLLSGEAQMYILMVLFTEVTTPFVNQRWYLDTAGMKNSKLYIYNGVALFFGWLVARIILFMFFFYHIFIHYDQVKQIFPLGFYSLLTVPPVISLMNVFWFWKITRGMADEHISADQCKICMFVVTVQGNGLIDANILLGLTEIVNLNGSFGIALFIL